MFTFQDDNLPIGNGLFTGLYHIPLVVEPVFLPVIDFIGNFFDENTDFCHEKYLKSFPRWIKIENADPQIPENH